jgi:hypothetical protein
LQADQVLEFETVETADGMAEMIHTSPAHDSFQHSMLAV